MLSETQAKAELLVRVPCKFFREHGDVSWEAPSLSSRSTSAGMSRFVGKSFGTVETLLSKLEISNFRSFSRTTLKISAVSGVKLRKRNDTVPLLRDMTLRLTKRDSFADKFQQLSYHIGGTGPI